MSSYANKDKNANYFISLTGGIPELLYAETNYPHQWYAQNGSVFLRMKAESHKQMNVICRNSLAYFTIVTGNKRRYQMHLENVENQPGPDPLLLNKTFSPVTSLDFFNAKINRLH